LLNIQALEIYVGYKKVHLAVKTHNRYDKTYTPKDRVTITCYKIYFSFSFNY